MGQRDGVGFRFSYPPSRSAAATRNTRTKKPISRARSSCVRWRRIEERRAAPAALARFDVEESSTALEEVAAMAAPPELREPIARLRQLVDGYEYEAAAAVVAELLGRLGGGTPS